MEVVGGSAADAAPDTDMALTVQNGEEAVTVETYTVTFALVSAADKQAIKDAVVNISYEDDWGDVISLEPVSYTHLSQLFDGGNACLYKRSNTGGS